MQAILGQQPLSLGLNALQRHHGRVAFLSEDQTLHLIFARVQVPTSLRQDTDGRCPRF